MVKGTHHTFGGFQFGSIDADRTRRMRLINERQITQIGFLCLGRICKADIQPVIGCRFCKRCFYDGETGTTNRLNLTRNGRCNRLGRILKALIAVVGACPNVVGQFGIAERHFRSILTCHTKARQHLRIERAVLHKLLNVDAHFLVQALDPSVGVLGFGTKATTETRRDTIPFNRQGDILGELLNDGLKRPRNGLNNADKACHIQRRGVDFTAKILHTRRSTTGATVDCAKSRFDGGHLL